MQALHQVAVDLFVVPAVVIAVELEEHQQGLGDHLPIHANRVGNIGLIVVQRLLVQVVQVDHAAKCQILKVAYLGGFVVVLFNVEFVPLHLTPPKRSGRRSRLLISRNVKRSILQANSGEHCTRPLMTKESQVRVMPKFFANMAFDPLGLFLKYCSHIIIFLLYFENIVTHVNQFV
jgi:hypothetical protein